MDTIIPLKSDQTIDHLEFGEVTAAKNIPVLGSVNNYSNLSNEFEITVMVCIINKRFMIILFLFCRMIKTKTLIPMSFLTTLYSSEKTCPSVPSMVLMLEK